MGHRSPTTEALKKLSRYCCQECGAKELFLYCWKGCRHVQGIKTFYADTRELRKQLETLQAAVYAQELRFHEYELQLKEKQQYLDFLGQRVVKLHDAVAQTAPKPLKLQADTPSWARVGVKMLWNSFCDGNGPLTDQALAALKQHLRANHDNVDRALDSDGVPGRPSVRDSALALLPLYDRRDGPTLLQGDLRSLGIQLGTSDGAADVVSTNDALLDEVAATFAELSAERDAFRTQFEDCERAKARLREAFAASTASNDNQIRELQELRKKCEVSENETRHANEKAAEFQVLLKRAETDFSAAKKAALDLRALVDDQISEREKWQRYCWELEERLHDAVETTRVKERDLWRTKDSKKEEVRKSMLLYMEVDKGKRHVRSSVPPQVSFGISEKSDPVDESRQSQPH